MKDSFSTHLIKRLDEEHAKAGAVKISPRVQGIIIGKVGAPMIASTHQAAFENLINRLDECNGKTINRFGSWTNLGYLDVSLRKVRGWKYVKMRWAGAVSSHEKMSLNILLGEISSLAVQPL